MLHNIEVCCEMCVLILYSKEKGSLDAKVGDIYKIISFMGHFYIYRDGKLNFTYYIMQVIEV